MRRRRLRSLRFAFWLPMVASVVASIHPRDARAEASPPLVSMSLHGCNDAFSDEVRRIAGIELHAVIVSPEARQRVVTETSVTCRDRVADLEVSDAATAKVSLRTVSLAETSPRARARLIALAMAELVSTSWEEVETNPEPKVPPAVKPSPEARAQVRRAVRRETRVTIDALASTRLFGEGALLFGGRVESAVRVYRSLLLRLGAGAEAGSASRSLGDVSVQTDEGSAGLGVAIDAGVFRAIPWAGVFVGYASLAGNPTHGGRGLVQSGLFTGPEAGVDLRLWSLSLVHLSLGLSGGGTFRGVRGDVDGGKVVGVSGPWGAVTLGAGISMR